MVEDERKGNVGIYYFAHKKNPKDANYMSLSALSHQILLIFSDAAFLDPSPP